MKLKENNMLLTARIDNDYKCMKSYFRKLFDVLQEGFDENRIAPAKSQDYYGNESQATYHSYTHFIKPDMLINIYSMVDFWMKEICEYQKNKKNYNLNYGDIRGKNELDTYHKYMTQCIKADLDKVKDSYKQLDNLRKIRNHQIHRGGHIPDDKSIEKELSSIKGIKLLGSLITIDDDFVWNTLDHAKKYLTAAAQA